MQKARPVLGRFVTADHLKGTVLVRPPRQQEFVELKKGSLIAVGSQLDTRKGIIRIRTATDVAGETQVGSFWKGVFEVRQSESKLARGLTELLLTGSGFRGCQSPSARARAARRSRRVIRGLRAAARGRFRTRGRYSAATVRGTTWGTVDRCDGTLTTVSQGEVSVRDFRRKRTVVVRPGAPYLVRAPG